MQRLIFALLLMPALLAGCMDVPSGAPPGMPGTSMENMDSSNLHNGPVINRFSVKPASIAPGDKAVLSWDVSDALSVSLNQGIGRVETTGSIEVSPNIQTVYVLTAVNQKGSAAARVTLNIQGEGTEKLPVILEFRSDPAVPKRGQPARLRWTTRGATQVTINNVPVSASGDKMIRLEEPTTFQIIVTNSYGSDIKYLSVPVE